MNLKQPKASILVFTLIVLFIGIAAAIGIASSSVNSQKSAITTASSVQSFQLADSGAEIFLNKFKDASGSANLTSLGSDLVCSGGVIRGNIGTGRDYEIIAYDTAGTALGCTATLSSIDKIKSVGKYKNTARAVEMAVAAGGNAGVTGGCMISSGSSSAKWGDGCKDNGTSGIGDFCTSVNVTGYSCGTSGGINAGIFYSYYCLCIKN